MDFSSNFIWAKNWQEHKKEKPTILYFRKKFKHASCIKISANSRYKLYINGVFVQEGPQKGTTENAFLDPADVGKMTAEAGEIGEAREIGEAGENIAAVEVLYYPESTANRNDSLYYSPFPCLFVSDEDGQELDGKSGWKCAYADHIEIVGEPFDPAPIHGAERAAGNEKFVGWKEKGYDDSDWEDVEVYDFFEVTKPIAPFDFEDRTIPPMWHEPKRFTDVVCVREQKKEENDKEREIVKEEIAEEWQQMLKGKSFAVIPANSVRIVEITAGEEMCGYPVLKLAHGKNADIKIIYAESYGIKQPDIVTPKGTRPAPPIKKDRTDWKNGELFGPEDHYKVSGYGKEEAPEIYEPYLFRTFRFLRLEITTYEEELHLLSYDYLSTGYPLEVKNHPVSMKEEYNQIWEISLRTLKRCMHETYVDCPFYEQLQYAMDSRAEILFTYEVAQDDRLARQCMESFRKTARSDGMIQASAPAVGVNVIPGFSMFYIMMVHDHMKYFQDKELVKKHFTCIDGILRYFDEHITEKGLVGSVGGVLFQHRYWSFIDWCEEWDETIGVPTAAIQGDGSVTMESLLYLYGLRCAAELAEFIERKSVAKEYRDRAEKVADAVKTYCVDKNGLIQDGPGLPLYSTHCQVWAILNDLLSDEQAKKNIKATYRVKGIPQCSVSMSFYLFLVFEKLHMLDTKEFDQMWDPWREMLRNHMTTCVENTTDGRSDCHAWGAIMLYALPRICKTEKGER